MLYSLRHTRNIEKCNSSPQNYTLNPFSCQQYNKTTRCCSTIVLNVTQIAYCIPANRKQLYHRPVVVVVVKFGPPFGNLDQIKPYFLPCQELDEMTVTLYCRFTQYEVGASSWFQLLPPLNFLILSLCLDTHYQ